LPLLLIEFCYLVAPEVATDKLYDAKCDCYSFALLFWEIMNLKKPFMRVTMDKLQRLVWNDTYQPAIMHLSMNN